MNGSNTHARWLTPAAVLALLAMTGCEAPPPQSTQQGFRGTGMVDVVQADDVAERKAMQTVPAPVPDGGPLAGEIYSNVQVLGDLSIGEFTRTMTAITAWVSPEQGCAYCHEGADMASDSLYTKVVSRRMLEMTRDINANAHVGAVGVTCYTCHRGQNVPENIWYKATPEDAFFVGNRDGQNQPSAVPQYAALPVDPFSDMLDGTAAIRVVSTAALPNGNPRNIKDTEATYGLMMHLSEALGANCTFCHNSRSFTAWDQSPPARVTAWHGIQMVRGLNTDYLAPLGSVLPAHRLGETGDAPKANCATCHQGQRKPLDGVSMLQDYPALQSR